MTDRLGEAITWLERHRTAVLAGLAVLAVALRVGYALWGVDPQLTDDETSFWAIAGNLASGGGFTYDGTPTAWRPPAYTGVLAALRVVGMGVRGVQLVQTLAGAAVVVLVYGCVRRLPLPAWSALVAAAVATAYPPLVHLPSQLLSENLSVPLYLAAIWVTLGVLRDATWVGAATAGLVWGTAALARPAVLPALGIAGLVVGLRAPWLRSLGQAAAVGAAAVLVIAPWTMRNAAQVGGPLPVVSNEGFTLWVSNRLDTSNYKDVFNDPDYPGLEDYGVYGRELPGILDRADADGFDFVSASEAARDRWFREQAWEAIGAEPGRFLRRTAVKTALALDPAPANASREEATSPVQAAVLWVTGVPVLLGGAAGLVVLVVRRRRRGLFLAGAATASLVGMAAHLPYVRYRVGVVDPILVIGTAAAVWWSARRLGWWSPGPGDGPVRDGA